MYIITANIYIYIVYLFLLNLYGVFEDQLPSCILERTSSKISRHFGTSTEYAIVLHEELRSTSASACAVPSK